MLKYELPLKMEINLVYYITKSKITLSLSVSSYTYNSLKSKVNI